MTTPVANWAPGVTLSDANCWRLAYLLIGLISATLSLIVQQATEVRGINTYTDIWFDMDVPTYSHLNKFPPRLRHLLLGIIITGPGAIITPVIMWLFDSDRQAAVTFITIAGVSIGGGFSAVILLAILRRLGLSVAATVLISMVDLLCLSRILVGSLGESYGYTALGLRMCMFLCVIDFDLRRSMSLLSWIVLGAFCAGITLTNAIFWGLCLLYVSFRETEKGIGFILLRAGGIYCAAAALTLAASLLASPIANMSVRTIIGSVRSSVGADAMWIQPLSAGRALQVVYAFTDGFIAPPPALKEMVVADSRIAADRPGHYVKGRAVSYQWTPSHPRTSRWQPFVLVAMLTLGARGLWSNTGPHRFVLTSSALWLAFNLCLNLKWGSEELFLYSMHWQCLTIIWLAGLFSLRRGQHLAGYTAIGSFLAGQLWYNIASVQEAIRLLGIASALLPA